MHIIYFYWMVDDANKVRAVAPMHVAYWRGLKLTRYLGGAFSDWTGGCITFEAESLAAAAALVARDPFLTEGCLREHHVKVWQTGA